MHNDILSPYILINYVIAIASHRYLKSYIYPIEKSLILNVEDVKTYLHKDTRGDKLCSQIFFDCFRILVRTVWNGCLE